MNTFKSQIKSSLQILLFPISMIFLLSPLEIYSGNINEFEFGINDYIFIFALAGLVLLLLGSVIISFIPDKVYKVVACFIFSISIMAYVQNMLLNIGIYNSSGARVEWNLLKNTMIINSIIWIVLIAILLVVLLLFVKKNVLKIVSTISLLLGLVQIVSTIMLLITTPFHGLAIDQFALSSKDQYSVAPNNNIIILVLDSYSNDSFDNYLNEFPDTKIKMKDFTYYNDASSDYRTTFPSICHMLTGAELSEDIGSVEKWKEEAWKTDKCNNIYDVLHKQDYTCNFYMDNFNYTIYGSNMNLQGKFDNIVGSKRLGVDNMLCFRLLLKMSLYKYAPFILKPQFEVMTYSFKDVVMQDTESTDGTIASANYEYYDGLINKGISVNEEMKNAFIFTLLDGIHSPYVNDANCKKISDGSVVDVTSVQQGIDVMLMEYIEQLKNANVYNNSTIIICADHGGAEPMLIMKLPNETHDEMQINSAPICYRDIWPTIFEIIGEDYESIGESILHIEENAIRERVLYSAAEKGYYDKYIFTDRNDLNSKYGKEYEHIWIMN